MKTKKKPVGQMTVAKLEALTADLDKEFVIDKFSPLTPKEKAQWERAKDKGIKPDGTR